MRRRLYTRQGRIARKAEAWQMKEELTLAKAWKDYLAHVYPMGTGPEQFNQIRQAFYSGALAMSAIQNLASDTKYSDKETSDILEAAFKEIMDDFEKFKFQYGLEDM